MIKGFAHFATVYDGRNIPNVNTAYLSYSNNQNLKQEGEDGYKPGEDTPNDDTRGDSYLIIEDYGTPLGVDVVINHVGDCFD